MTEEKQNGVQGPLRLLLRSFKLKGFIDNYQAVAEESERAGRTFENFLYELAKVEAHERRGRRIHRLGKDSKIPREKTLATFDLARIPMVPRPLVAQLSEGGFLDRAENLLVFGNPGTGKTHLVAAVGHELVRNGHSVYFTPAYALVQTLVAAKRALRLTRELARLDRFECLILDDLGYVQQEREEMDVLFTLLAERYERRSVVITSNLVFSKWNQIFKDTTTTAAAIDRLVHHARILELDVESFRAQEADGRRRTKDGKRGTSEKSQDDENDVRKGGET